MRPQVGPRSAGYKVAWDDVTNAQLLPELIKKAREVEMGYFTKLGVFEYATHAQQQQQTLGKIIGVRWVDVNKGDSEEPKYTS